MTSNLIHLHGIVRSGKGDFAHWIEKPSDHYLRKTGVRLFPGTLNVHLANTVYRFPKDEIIRLEGSEYGGQVNVSILPCRIFDRSAFVLRTDTDRGKYGNLREAILEIASDLSLRATYGLEVGDTIEVLLPAEEPLEFLGASEGVSVRVFSEADSAVLFNIISNNREHLRPWFDFVDAICSLEDTKIFIRKVQNNLHENGRFWCGIWCNDQLCGAIGLTKLHHENRNAEFGIWLASNCTGRGIATRAAGILVNFLLNDYRLECVTARCAVINVRRIALMERLGFSREKCCPDAEIVNGSPCDAYIYSLEKSQWAF